MELLQLKYFCDAAQTENFSKTAEKFMVPVSSVSQSIKRLETELGNPLFARTKNRIQLNSTGKEFFNEAKKALDILDEAAYTAKHLQPRKTIAVNVYIGRWIVTDAIEKYRQRYPDVTIATDYNPSAPIENFDILVTDKVLSGPYSCSEVMDERLVLAYSRKHFPQIETLPPEKLCDYSFITTAPGGAMEHFTYRICEDLGFRPHVVLQSDDTFFFRRCVTLGLVIAIVPQKAWKGHVAEHIAFKELGPYTHKIYIHQKVNGNLYLKDFANLLRTEFSKL